MHEQSRLPRALSQPRAAPVGAESRGLRGDPKPRELMKTPTQRASAASQSLAPTGATGTTPAAASSVPQEPRGSLQTTGFPGILGGKTLLKISIFISRDPGAPLAPLKQTDVPFHHPPTVSSHHHAVARTSTPLMLCWWLEDSRGVK